MCVIVRGMENIQVISLFGENSQTVGVIPGRRYVIHCGQGTDFDGGTLTASCRLDPITGDVLVFSGKTTVFTESFIAPGNLLTLAFNGTAGENSGGEFALVRCPLGV